LGGLVLLVLTLSFVDTSFRLPPAAAAAAKWQLVPAVLAGNLLTVGAVLLSVLLFGRIYCSVICPLGLTQDVISSIGPKRRFRYYPAKNKIRLAVLILFGLAFAAGWPLVFGLLEPYSAFGRIASSLAGPLWALGSNFLAWLSERAGNFLVSPSQIWLRGLTPMLAAAVTLAVLIWWSRKSGRYFCGTLCPVGTVLGFLSRKSFFRPRIIREKCLSCGRCERVCKAGCLFPKEGILDSTRCVSCFCCREVCPAGAIAWTPLPPGPGLELDQSLASKTRRAFLGTALGLMSYPLLAQQVMTDRPARELTRKTPPRGRTVPVIAPGAGSLAAYEQKCTGCQLCLSACPNSVLKTRDSGRGLLQPAMTFERGFCRITCTVCSEVCPSGAIRPISPAVKSSIQIGLARIDSQRCIIQTDEVGCTACFRNCPSGAISLIEAKDGSKHPRPAVDQSRCLGCGACEYHCPVRPEAAVWVEGHLTHAAI
ncbi:MAG: 4Fe-4S dicluster domain-containing protein, partial [Deltaproteobacteria bacterium]|nr:4Fe-4S dicluster domain-containing protein [Deltaproteobacteria bacterium]